MANETTRTDEGVPEKNPLTRRTFIMGVGGAAFMAACGGKAIAPKATLPAAAAPAEEAQPTVPPPVVVNENASKSVAFWYGWNTPPQAKAARESIKAFAKDNPDISVKLTTGAQVDTKLIPAITAGNPPDVSHLFSAVPLAARNALMALDEYLDASEIIKADNYTEAQWNAVTWEGKRYAVPSLENGPRIGLIWNKGLFKKAGLDPERGPATLDELLQYHEKLTEVDKNGNVRVIGFDPRDAMASSEGFFQWWASANDVDYYSADGKTLNINDPKLIEGVQFVADIYKKLGPEKIAGFRNSYGTWTGPDSSFAQGKQAMQINGYWTPGELKAGGDPNQKYAYGWLPVASKEKFMLYGGHSMAIPRGAKDPATAFKLIEFFTTARAGQIMFDNTGFLNGNKEFFNQGSFRFAPDVKWFLTAGQESKVKAASPTPIPVFEEVRTRFESGVDEVVRGKRTAKNMLDELQSQMQKTLDEQMGS